MIRGDVARFAIEAEATHVQDGWLFGHMRFWLSGKAVGNWNDDVDLLGCLRWLEDFADVPRDRVAPEVFALPPREVFRRVYDPVIANTGAGPAAAGLTDAYERFHISHLAMSAFDRFDVLLVGNGRGVERCLWREMDGPISDVLLREGEMAEVARRFCRDFVVPAARLAVGAPLENPWSTTTEATMRSAGWHSGRRAIEQTARWIEKLAATDGLVAHDAAVAALEEFGGLRVEVNGPGRDFRRTSFDLDPTLVVGEGDRMRESTLDEALFPLGEVASGEAFLAVAPSGRVYMVGVVDNLIGRSMAEAIECLLVGRRLNG